MSWITDAMRIMNHITPQSHEFLEWCAGDHIAPDAEAWSVFEHDLCVRTPDGRLILSEDAVRPSMAGGPDVWLHKDDDPFDYLSDEEQHEYIAQSRADEWRDGRYVD